jgi:ribosomal protein S18 acetylase RimI-like enzyme
VLRKFRCDVGGWFARDVQRLIRRRVATAVAADEAEVLVFEFEDEIVAVAVFELDPDATSICDLHAIAIANDHQGSRTQTGSGELPLVKVVLDTCMKYAADLGAEAVRAIVARDNTRSIRMLLLEGFMRADRFDKDYDEYVVSIRRA